MSAPAISTQTLAEAFFDLFPGFDGAHGETRLTTQQSARGKIEAISKTVHTPPSLELWEKHLAGKVGLGIAPLRTDGTCRWGAIDIDDYDLDWEKLERDLARLDLGLIPCKTKSGGAHLYLFLSEDVGAELVRQRLSQWAAALGHAGVEVFPKQTRLEPGECPNWLNMPYWSRTKRQAIKGGKPLDTAAFFEVARAITLSREDLEQFQLPEDERLPGAPPCLQCLAQRGCAENRNKFLFNLGVYARKSLGDDAVADKLDEYNRDFMQTPLGQKEVAQVAKSVGKKDYGYLCKEAPINAVCDRKTCLTREFGIGGYTEGDEALVKELNERHALVLIGDKSAILQTGNPEGIRLLSLGAFKEWHRPHRVQSGNRSVTRAEYWLNHPQRRQHEGLVFSPGREVPGYYNLWRGFAIEPNSEGDCQRFLDHLHDNVCQGRDDLYLYFVGWLAQMIQQPATKPGTSIVLRGRQGTGKTIVGKTMGALLGGHYALVADPRYITGRFNSHLTDKLLLHADEGFWAGDHTAEGKLKDLITGDYQWIEFKGKESIRVRNYLRLLVTGNAQWIVPAGMEERRFAVFDVGEGKMQDLAYFGALEAQLQAGGYGALLHHLTTFDLGQVELRRIPETAALYEQKMSTLSAEEAWLLDLLTSGKLPGDAKGLGHTPTPILYEHYVRHAQRVGTKRRSIETQLGNFLNKQVPGLTKRDGTYEDSFTGETRRAKIYHFPELTKCRAAFAQATRYHGDWEEPHEWASSGF